MNYGIMEALNQLTRERRVDKALLFETLEAGLTQAIKKKYGNNNAIALAKQVLVQRVREVERGKIFDEYKNRVGEVITGTVQQQDRTGVIVTLGKAEAFLPKKESIRRERWHQGLPIKAYVIEVLDVTKGPQVILSRTHPGLIEKLFEAEVPEIYDDIVEIKSVARDAGGRTKIAVYSKDERVDAVGACVGMKGSRVQAVVKELSGERVDIVPWNEEPQQFVIKALSPAKVQSVRVDRDRQEMTVVVDDEQLSLAIGREGQNVRLAVKLTGWRIDLVSSSEMVQRERLDKELRVALDDVEGFEGADVAALESVGVHTLKELMAADEAILVADKGLDAELVARARALGQQRTSEIQQAFAERREAESKLFDEAMFDRVGTEEEAEAAGPTTLTFTPESELEDAGEETGEETSDVAVDESPELEAQAAADDTSEIELDAAESGAESGTESPEYELAVTTAEASSSAADDDIAAMEEEEAAALRASEAMEDEGAPPAENADDDETRAGKPRPEA
jgi:N utilization substance protein A